jgi:hypothetical protein
MDSEVTRILSDVERGDPQAAGRLPSLIHRDLKPTNVLVTHHDADLGVLATHFNRSLPAGSPAGASTALGRPPAIAAPFGASRIRRHDVAIALLD